MTQALALRDEHMPNPLGNLQSYINVAYQYPVLSAEEEHDLAVCLRDEGDLVAARRLVMHNLRFVVQVARGYNGYGLALGDLIQEGNIGLMKAIKRFDPEVGVRLVSFAVHWIRAEIHEFILKNWRIVKVATTKAQRKLFFNLRKAKQRLGWFNQEEVEAVANDLGVTPKDVMEMESRLSNYDMAFDTSSTDSDDDDYTAPAYYLQSDAATPEDTVVEEDLGNHQARLLAQGMEKLDDRSRNILKRRWIDEPKATLHELAAEYGVSAERIRQIETNAMKKLRGVFEA